MTDPERKPPEHVSISPEPVGAIEPVPFDTLGGRLSLQKAARLVGVKTATLQAWESHLSNFHDQAGKTIAKLEKELRRLRAAG